MMPARQLFIQKVCPGFLIGITASLFALALQAAGWLEELEWKTFDVRARLVRSSTPPPESIAIILIDEASLEMMNPLVGRWPWPRSIHADTIDFLASAGARWIVYDVLFTENEKDPASTPQRLAANDQRLVAAAAAAGNLVSAVQMVRDQPDSFNETLLNRPLPENFKQRFSLRIKRAQRENDASNKAYLPFRELLEKTAAIGLVDFAPDRDGVYRRAELVRTYDGEIYPSLALAALKDRWSPAALTDDWLLMQSQSENVKLKIPLVSNGQYLLNPYKEFATYSMSGLLLTMQKLRQGQIENLPLDPAVFNDKIVFVGASAVGVEDLKATSFGFLQPGVFLHAAIAGNVLEKDFLREPGMIVELIMLVLFSVLLPLTVLLGRNNRWRVIAPLFLYTVLLLGIYQAFVQGIVLAGVLPVTGMSLAWLGALARLSATEGRDKRRIRAMFGQYVSPQILESLTANAARGLLQAEIGRREHLTILFSDIRGFTSLSEQMAPEDVVEILNGYFRGMVDIIFLRKGTLDKFIGDAIMAFWGAPLRIEQPARQAVTAAMEMVKWLETYNEGLIDRGIAPLEIGIGLHSGSVVLGNIGSEKKLDFTIIGDNVNLASRLEGLTKNYGSRLLISETTQREIGDDFICRVLDSVRVKGKNRPIRIFEVLAVPADDPDTRSVAQKRAKITARAFECYLQQDWESAIVAYAALSEFSGCDPLTPLFVTRCQIYQQQGPGKDWDGVYQMTTK